MAASPPPRPSSWGAWLRTSARGRRPARLLPVRLPPLDKSLVANQKDEEEGRGPGCGEQLRQLRAGPPAAGRRRRRPGGAGWTARELESVGGAGWPGAAGGGGAAAGGGGRPARCGSCCLRPRWRRGGPWSCGCRRCSRPPAGSRSRRAPRRSNSACGAGRRGTRRWPRASRSGTRRPTLPWGGTRVRGAHWWRRSGERTTSSTCSTWVRGTASWCGPCWARGSEPRGLRCSASRSTTSAATCC